MNLKEEYYAEKAQILSVSGSAFLVFGLKTEIYSVNLCTQSKSYCLTDISSS